MFPPGVSASVNASFCILVPRMTVEMVEELWKKLIDSLMSTELAESCEVPWVSSKVRENLSVVKE